MATVLAGIAQHGILAGDVGEAPEVGDIRKLRAAGGDPLVATRPREKAVALRDGADRGLQQGQCGDGIGQAVGQDFGDAPRIRAAGPGQGAGGKPACVKP